MRARRVDRIVERAGDELGERVVERAAQHPSGARAVTIEDRELTRRRRAETVERTERTTIADRPASSRATSTSAAGSSRVSGRSASVSNQPQRMPPGALAPLGRSKSETHGFTSSTGVPSNTSTPENSSVWSPTRSIRTRLRPRRFGRVPGSGWRRCRRARRVRRGGTAPVAARRRDRRRRRCCRAGRWSGRGGSRATPSRSGRGRRAPGTSVGSSSTTPRVTGA